MSFWPVLRTLKKDLNFTSRDSKELMAKGAFNLRKWNWNSSELLQLINKKEESIAQTKTEKTNAVVEEEDESFIKFSVGPTRTADTLVKTLGFVGTLQRMKYHLIQLIESANTRIIWE